jgi:glyoxylase I family protein
VLRPNSLDHVVFRVRDLERTERFYSVLLGEPFKADGYVLYMVGDTRLFFTPSADHAATYDKENVGLNHIALGVSTIEELQNAEAQLNQGGIVHSGIKFWRDGKTRYIWMDDPDGIRVEYWLRLPEEPAF